MQYTAEDYNVTVSRGFVREDGKMLWGRNPNLKGGLEWRTPKAYKTAVQQNRNNRGARYVEHNERINKIKLEKGCCMCGFGGSHFPKKFHQHIVMLLEFDHIDPSTKYENVSQMKNYSWDVIQSEIDKCRVLCKPCHAKHTGEQNRTE
jgi:hypothetical protein